MSEDFIKIVLVSRLSIDPDGLLIVSKLFLMKQESTQWSPKGVQTRTMIQELFIYFNFFIYGNQ